MATKKKNRKNRIQFLKEKYIPLIEKSPFLEQEKGYELNGTTVKSAEDVFELFKKYDPSFHKKYLFWMLERFLDERKEEGPEGKEVNVKRLIVEDLPKFSNSLDFFMKHKERFDEEKRNINKFEGIQQFFDAVEKAKPKDGESISLSQMDKKYKSEIDIWLDNDRWKIVIPKTPNAASIYGKGSRWCTTSENGGVFERYNKDGPLIIIIDKKANKNETKKHKYQFHFETNQFMDASDESIPKMDFLSENEDILNALLKNLKNSHSTPLKIKFGKPLKEEDKIIKKSREEEKLSLDLSDIKVSELEPGLYVEGDLILGNNQNIRKISNIEIAGNLDAEGSSIEKICGNVKIDGTCYLNNCNDLKYLSEDIKVGGALELKYCNSLQELPKFGDVGYHLYVSGSPNVKDMPKTFKVGYRAYLRDTLWSHKISEGEIEKPDFSEYSVGNSIEYNDCD